MKNVLHFANYKALYKGNFIESLRLLSTRLKCKAVETVFCFPVVDVESNAAIWMDEIRQDGDEVFNFNDNVIEDAKLIRVLIKKKNIGIIHVHFFTMEHILSVKLATIGLNVKIIMHFHNHSLPAKGAKSYLRQLFYGKTVMISCSESVGDSIQRDYPKNTKYNVDNGVKFDRLNEFISIDRLEYGLKLDSKLILIFGFDYYRKGVDVAINALKALNETGDCYELIVSLSKNKEIVSDEIIKEHGEMPSFVKLIDARSDVASLYNLCDMFISPSREEGLPYSVIEASYCQCSIVVSDIAPQKCLSRIPYIVFHKADNAKSLKDAIAEAMEQRSERKENLGDIRSFLQENYSLEKWTDSIIDIYNEVW